MKPSTVLLLILNKNIALVRCTVICDVGLKPVEGFWFFFLIVTEASDATEEETKFFFPSLLKTLKLEDGFSTFIM